MEIYLRRKHSKITKKRNDGRILPMNMLNRKKTKSVSYHKKCLFFRLLPKTKTKNMHNTHHKSAHARIISEMTTTTQTKVYTNATIPD